MNFKWLEGDGSDVYVKCSNCHVSFWCNPHTEKNLIQGRTGLKPECPACGAVDWNWGFKENPNEERDETMPKKEKKKLTALERKTVGLKRGARLVWLLWLMVLVALPVGVGYLSGIGGGLICLGLLCFVEAICTMVVVSSLNKDVTELKEQEATCNKEPEKCSRCGHPETLGCSFIIRQGTFRICRHCGQALADIFAVTHTQQEEEVLIEEDKEAPADCYKAAARDPKDLPFEIMGPKASATGKRPRHTPSEPGSLWSRTKKQEDKETLVEEEGPNDKEDTDG